MALEYKKARAFHSRLRALMLYTAVAVMGTLSLSAAGRTRSVKLGPPGQVPGSERLIFAVPAADASAVAGALKAKRQFSPQRLWARLFASPVNPQNTNVKDFFLQSPLPADTKTHYMQVNNTHLLKLRL
ncbi:MAG: hypothetical protein LBR23_04060 [Spirochaetaceae bacterium]|jgi:hypothetical protein|nr:hypothetical protein [Spirochaetaceae bacterium]